MLHQRHIDEGKGAWEGERGRGRGKRKGGMRDQEEIMKKGRVLSTERRKRGMQDVKVEYKERSIEKGD